MRVGRSTGAVDARVDDYSDVDRDLSTAACYFIHPTGDGSARRRLGAVIAEDAETTAIVGKKVKKTIDD